MRALGNEVAKNLVLAGIGRLTVLDPDDVVEDDLGSQFFVTEEHVGMNVYTGPFRVAIRPVLTDVLQRAEAAQPAMQKLNPRVPVHTDTDSVRSKAPEYFKSFDIVIATDLDIDNLVNTSSTLPGGTSPHNLHLLTQPLPRCSSTSTPQPAPTTSPSTPPPRTASTASSLPTSSPTPSSSSASNPTSPPSSSANPAPAPS